MVNLLTKSIAAVALIAAVICEMRDSIKPVVVTADRIEAKYIALVDERGKERAEMFCSGSKSNPVTVIRILGKNGLPKVTLQADAEGSYVILEQPDGKHGISLGVSERSNVMMISDSQGRPIYQCGIYHDKQAGSGDGKPAIILTDFDTGQSWQMIVGI